MTETTVQKQYILTGWHGGSSGAKPGGTYGLRFGILKKVLFGSTRPKSISVLLAGQEPFEIDLSPGFWNHCPEIRSPKIRDWFIKIGITLPWPKNQPPKFQIEKIGPKTFRVNLPSRETSYHP